MSEVKADYKVKEKGGASKLPEDKPVDLRELSIGQRANLKEGMKSAIMDDPLFKAIGSDHKVIFHSTCSMFNTPEGLGMLNLKGVEHWKEVAVPGQEKKEQVRFVKFTFNYVLPGTSSSLQAEKEWRYEDFK